MAYGWFRSKGERRRASLVLSVKRLAVLAVLYACFRYFGDFPAGQSVLLALVAFGTVFAFAASRQPAAQSNFSPFRVSIQPNWYALLSDFKLVKTKEEGEQLAEREAAVSPEVRQNRNAPYDIFRNGLTFTVTSPRHWTSEVVYE